MVKKIKQKNNKSALERFQIKTTQSLLESMRVGNEYGSIVGVVPPPDFDIVGEVIRGLKAIREVRQRPCLSYIGNVVARAADVGVDSSDDLPFAEMVNSVPQSERKVDVFLSTLGGNAHQVSRFVNCLRARFDEVDFIIPSFCMSAGTLFALSGDKIWMTDRACLGPIDPQIPTADGRYVPAQSLLLLVDRLQVQGQEALKNTGSVPWTAVRIIDTIDKKELGDALTASAYSITMAREFLVNYKFRHWTMREGSQQAVTPEYRAIRASKIAETLAKHDEWKSHGHAISRDVLWNRVQLKIDHPSVELLNPINRLWALCTWIFDKTPVLKLILSENYRYLRHNVKTAEAKRG